MAGFARVNEKSRCAGTGQCRRHLVANVTRLAHAGHYDATTALNNQLAGAGEILIQMVAQQANRFLLEFYRAACGVNKVKGG